MTLHGVVAMQAGVEAEFDRGIMADVRTLEILANIGNDTKRGVVGHFGHIAMSENAAGKKIMRSTNFRVEGNQLLHDVQLIEGARRSPVYSRDVVDYVLTMAESHPTELAESVVILTNVAWVMPDGQELDADDPGTWGDDVDRVNWRHTWKPSEAVNEIPVMRPVRFYSLDIVGDGALTPNGLFDAQAFGALVAGTSSEYANALFMSIDQFREQFSVGLDELPGKVARTLGVYLQSRGYKGSIPMEVHKHDTPDTQPDEPTQVVAEQQANEPAAPDAFEETAAAVQAAASAVDDLQAEDENAPDDPTENELLQARIAAQDEVIEAQTVRLEHLLELVKANAETITKLTRDVQRLAGEQVVKASVPRVPQTTLESAVDDGHRRALAAGIPASVLGQQPVGVRERLAEAGGEAPTDPALRALANSKRRRPVSN